MVIICSSVAHRLPQLLPLDIDGGVVHQQLVLAEEAVEDRLDVPWAET
jgi:hypothetical protein